MPDTIHWFPAGAGWPAAPPGFFLARFDVLVISSVLRLRLRTGLRREEGFFADPLPQT
jgi:hypothetical protein